MIHVIPKLLADGPFDGLEILVFLNEDDGPARYHVHLTRLTLLKHSP